MELNIPEGINYECTGCGKCCSGWSVPLTQQDYERIAPIDWGTLNSDLKDKNLFRPLKLHEKLNTPYTHAINAEPNGQCPFLKNNLCFIHGQFGATVKPAICQLFPYSFNETPSGIFATVSFISRGAIFNAGRSLIEQKEYLKSKYAEFKNLFPNHHPNWSAIKLSSNAPLTWPEYLEIEKDLLNIMKDPANKIEIRFINGSIYLNSLLPKKLPNTNEHKPSLNLKEANIQTTANEKTLLNSWDKIILSTLYKTYFPEQKNTGKSYGQLTLGPGNFIYGFFHTHEIDKLLSNPNNFSELKYNDEITNLIYRFFYSRLFAKLYFGAGFGQLSLIAGFNHLALLLVLLKLKACQNAKLRDNASTIIIDDLIPAIVQLEKNLGELKISPYGAAMLELLLGSQQRITRILSLC